MMMNNQDQQLSKTIYEISALLFAILRSSPGSGPPPPRRTAVSRSDRNRLTPAALASLLLGVSLVLMLCGSVTFVIGFMLMPWILGLVMVLYFFGIVSSLSGLGKAILCPNLSEGSSPKAANEIDVSSPRFRSFRSKRSRKQTAPVVKQSIPQLIAPYDPIMEHWMPF